ncbi:MAG: glycosyltransferase family 9 protein [Bacteroidales bacterium]|nr:glycosyltransferase family 9 protein [Bacteroidales bacterium]
MNKYLIIRLSSIGDIVLTTPVVRCLKLQADPCEIHYLTKKQFLPVLQANPYIDKIYTLNDSVDEVSNTLKNEKYDHIIDLHKNFRSVTLRRILGVKSSSFPKLNLKKWMLVNLKIDLMPEIHIVDRSFEAVKNLGVKNDLAGLDYFIPEMDKVKVSDLPPAHQKGYLAMVIGGKHQTKQLPAEKVIALCKIIRHPILILGGSEDFEMANQIAESDSKKIFNTCGKFSINQSASLVEQAKMVVTNDTGLMHVAAAFHKKIISVWGNTVPELGMYPYLPKEPEKFSVYEVKNLSCRPCSKIGFEKCPKKHFKCMMDQDIRGIGDEVNLFLESLV